VGGQCKSVGTAGSRQGLCRTSRRAAPAETSNTPHLKLRSTSSALLHPRVLYERFPNTLRRFQSGSYLAREVVGEHFTSASQELYDAFTRAPTWRGPTRGGVGEHFTSAALALDDAFNRAPAWWGPTRGRAGEHFTSASHALDDAFNRAHIWPLLFKGPTRGDHTGPVASPRISAKIREEYRRNRPHQRPPLRSVAGRGGNRGRSGKGGGATGRERAWERTGRTVAARMRGDGALSKSQEIEHDTVAK
jgi:hypothetical protein